MKLNIKANFLYWVYNILLLLYWATLIPVLIYRLFREEGFFQRIKQSIGWLPEDLKKKISDRDAIWIHAASVGEIVAASPIVREMRKEHPEEVIIVSVVTATGFSMAHRIIDFIFPSRLAVFYESYFEYRQPQGDSPGRN